MIIHPWYQLGYIIPHLQTDMDAYQFYNIAPKGMILVTTGLNLQGHSIEAVEAELPAFWRAIDLLKKKKVDRIALSGVPVASYLGRERMREMLAEAEQRSGIPCDTDLEAHIAALKHLGATKIALATRWHEPTNTALTKYLNEAGIEVVALRARGSTLEQHKLANPAADHQLALELAQVLCDAPKAQAIMMPGGLWHAIHAVPLIEAQYGVPATLNITATTWAALHAAGPRLLHKPKAKQGRLLASL
jgi:maleate cis-trans isomerase